MNTSIKLISYLHAVFIYTVLFISASAMAETYTETFKVNAGGELNIQTDTGSIKIDTHDKNIIELTVKVENQQDNKFNYNSNVSDGNLTIIGKIEKNNYWPKNLKVKFSLKIPKTYNIKLDTSGGALSIEDLIGDVDARTSGGSINTAHIIGNAKLHTSGGSINIDSITGNVDAHTSGGSIKVTIDKQQTKDAKLTTSGGSITAYLIADIRTNIEASTSGGRVKSDFDIDGNIKKRTVKGSINGGGPKLTLKTSGGNIKIKKI